MRKVALSTSDNPFNPITEYETWLQFDLSHGYNSNQYVANITEDYDDLMNEKQVTYEIEKAIDNMIRLLLKHLKQLTNQHVYPLFQ